MLILQRGTGEIYCGRALEQEESSETCSTKVWSKSLNLPTSPKHNKGPGGKFGDLLHRSVEQVSEPAYKPKTQQKSTTHTHTHTHTIASWSAINQNMKSVIPSPKTGPKVGSMGPLTHGAHGAISERRSKSCWAPGSHGAMRPMGPWVARLLRALGGY